MNEYRYLTNHETVSERRKDKRFKARDGAVAVVGGDTYLVGSVIDLSIKGLSFRYIDDGKKKDNASELAIIVTGQGFYLRMIPVSTVYDIKEKSKVSFISIKMRRRGVQFGRLTVFQVALLRYFIQNFTTDEI